MTNNPFTNAPAKRSTAEFRLHVAVVEHLNSCFPSVLFTHPAQKAKDGQEGYFNKLMGVRKGVPDLLLWWEWSPNTVTRCGAIELKSTTGKPSGWQANFEVIFKALGGKHAYCRSVKEVHDVLVSWGCTPKYSWTKEPDIRSQQQKFSDSFEMFRP